MTHALHILHHNFNFIINFKNNPIESNTVLAGNVLLFYRNELYAKI